MYSHFWQHRPMRWTPTYPQALRDGSLVAVTAPSSGVAPPLHPRLDLVIESLRCRGFRVREGRCLRSEHKNASADAHVRASEWMATLLDDEVDAVLPPWGGERAIELLALIDFEALRRVRAKWVLGYSDLATLMLPLTLLSGWATAHGPNLMDLAPGQNDSLTAHALDALRGGEGAVIEQAQSQAWQSQWEDFAVDPRCTYRLTEPTRWRPLSDKHRLGVNFSGRLIGRSKAPDGAGGDSLLANEALEAALGDLPCPVLLDVDLGHVPPQMTLINGALATVCWSEERGGRVRQELV